MEIDGTTFPLKEHLGFTIEHGDRTATATLAIDDRHLNPNGVVHGSVLFAMMDTAMGAAVMATLEDGAWCATIEMQTRFHSAASSGRLIAVASVVSGGRRIVQLDASTIDDQNKLIASATASFAVFAPESHG